MRKAFGILVIVSFPIILQAEVRENRKSFFINLAKLEFDAARHNASLETDSLMKSAMTQLADILFYEGQKERAYFKSSEDISVDADLELSFVRSLCAGYLSLYYDRGKSNSYKNFFQAFQLAKSLNDKQLIKASLLAFFKYYNSEVAQVSDSYETQLGHFETLKEDFIDDVWLTVYRMIFYSKRPMSLGTLDDRYFEHARLLDEYENKLDPKSPVLAHVFYEKAIRFQIDKDDERCATYLKKVIDQARDYPFLKDERFLTYIQLFTLETSRDRFNEAKVFLESAKKEVNLADTLRSNYYLNLYSAVHLYSNLEKYDSAFHLLKKAYLQEFQIDFRRNALEINRLNVELETQEKENANLRLRQTRFWLAASLLGVALLLLVSYFAYANQRIKNKVLAHQAQLRVVKLLKEQEQIGINAMLEGQDKERQRIANELHDHLGSLLTTVKFHFNAFRNQYSGQDIQSKHLMETTDRLLDEAYQQTRTIAHMKNAGVSGQEGLVPALKNFAAKVSAMNRLTIDVNDHGMDKRLDATLEITIFRIIQELIANIVKHANASYVVIDLTQHENSLSIMVEDNGIGFKVEDVRPTAGMGLHSIQKRVEGAGGTVAIESILKNGTTVIIDLPTS